ncbi:TonB-dependent receptor [Filimonas lacunae]|nr:TonB-dependent receptor [Filimonas lacunae]
MCGYAINRAWSLNGMVTKIVRIMRLMAVLLLAATFAVQARPVAQTVSLTVKQMPLKQVFSMVEKQTGYAVFGNRSVWNQARPVTVSVANMPLDSFLAMVLTGRGLAFRLDSKTISLYEKENAVTLKDKTEQVTAMLLNAANAVDIRGKVTDEKGNALPGVAVIVKGSSRQVMTDEQGVFTVSGVDKDAVLLFSSINMEPLEVKVNGRTAIEVTLKTKVTELTDMVVTGVAISTSRAKTPFAVAKVDEKLINTVPALDLSQTLRAKVAGITIIQDQGNAGASVSLRGAKSFYGNIDPLIVVDGFVSNLTLSNLNPQDVESIEVVKGAAASAMYGTRAEGGVIQVITKKGRDARGKLNITFDNEYGRNSVQRTPRLATLHRWKTDPNDVYGFAYLTDQNGNKTNSRIANVQDNGFSEVLSPYKHFYDNVGLLMNNRPFYVNFLSLSTGNDKYNIYMSFQNQQNSGVVAPVGADVRRTAKLNLQLRPVPKLEIEADVHYFYTNRPSVIANAGGASSFFGQVLTQEPFINLDQRDSSGNYVAVPRGYKIQNLNLNSNPLYTYSKRQYKNPTSQILVGGKMRYAFSRKISAEVNGSINQSFSSVSSLYPKGYVTALEDVTLNNGNLYLSSGKNQFINGQAQVNYQDKFGDINFAASAKSVYEYYYSTFFSASGYGFSVPLYTLANTSAASRSISGSEEPAGKTVNYGYFLNVRMDYKDKYMLDVLGRIDQSSRYGSNAQTAFFPRLSAAYRVTKDFDLGNKVNELKVRLSWGRAGRIPAFNAKESLASVSNSGISITQNENTYLQRSYTTEVETGFDARFFRKLNVTFNYSKSNSKGDFVQPPVFLPTLGSTPAYKNFGLITSNTIELEVRANDIVVNKVVKWDAGLTFSRVRSKIKELGDGLPAFYNGNYRVDKGLSPWSFFGQKVLTSLSELQVVNGLVTNAAGGTHSLSDFVVNAQQHVVLKSNAGTVNEKPLVLQENGVAKSMVVGDAQPDFTTGFNTTLTFFDKLQLYATLDWQHGGKKYNGTTQYLTSYDRSGIWQDYAAAGLPEAYMQALYNGNTLTNFWLESASYLSLREISLSYTLPRFKGIKVLQSARIALTGRNLYTWSKFSGSNPEGYFDNYPYPVYRTYTAKLTLNF